MQTKVDEDGIGMAGRCKFLVEFYHCTVGTEPKDFWSDVGWKIN